MKENNKNGEKIKRKNVKCKNMVILALLSIVVSLMFVYLSKKDSNVNTLPKLDKLEVLKSMSYEQVKDGEENIDATNNVKFDAFFLRDLDNNGYAEKLRGTCRKIGGEDVLYMEINVLTSGYLKDGKITIDGKNFYLNTTLPKDNELMDNYIGTNIKEIKLNNINNGTQKTLTGIVRSGNYSSSYYKKYAISSTSINDYSRNDNEITLTGIYVDNGVEIPITKKVKLTVDWYGTTRAYINTTSSTYTDLDSRLDKKNEVINLQVYVSSQEGDRQLNLSKNYVEGTVPELNGYAPQSVTCSSSNIDFTYDETTRVFTITKLAKVDDMGKITTTLSDSNNYTVKIAYPLEAYTSLGADTVTIKIPVKTYYEGFNNPNEEFTNPYKSNVAEAIIVQTFRNPTGNVANIDVTVGRYLSSPYYRYSISKEKPLKIYNGVSESEKDDTYKVSWYVTTGTEGKDVKFTLKETKDSEAQISDQFIKTNSSQDSMENLTTNIGIYFSNITSMIGNDGILKIYDDETDKLLETFTKDDWEKYTSTNPYKYEKPVKHIRIETSEALANKYMYIYNIKELDDKYITENYTREEFDTLAYIKSTLTAYVDGEYLTRDTHQAKYEEAYSIATISISKETISTQTIEKNEKIDIKVEKNESSNTIGWKNGNFLVKLPKEILELEINDVTINNNKVKIINYEIIEQDGYKFIKVNTLNVNDNEQSYTITINADITPDPRSVTTYKSIELYANNEIPSTYYYATKDIYDVNLNLNTEEKVNKTSTALNLISPNSLLTNKIATNFDDKGTVLVSPQVANVNAKQTEGVSKATIGVQFRNNYTSSVSEVVILGKIPFEGNTYVLSKGDLKSQFTTAMDNTGIKVPDELAGEVTVYYSENEDPDKDLSNIANGWKKAENVTDWGKIKSYLIDFGDIVIERLSEYTFYYNVIMPKEEDLNKVAYAHHAIFFSFDTEQGKYRTKTEPNKIGVRIAETYNINLTKYQKGFDNVVYGAKYSITEIKEDGTKGESKTALTNINGKLSFKNVFVGKTYEIKEEVTATGYELNKDIIRITASLDEDGKVKINKTVNSASEEIEIEKDANRVYNYELRVEDAAEINFEIIKTEKETDNKIQGVEYKLTGGNFSSSGRRLKTDANGKITLMDLNEGQLYTLEEIKADNYYLAEPIKFKINNTNGIYTINILQGQVKQSNVTMKDDLAYITLNIENEKIETFILEVNKIKKSVNIETGDATTYLAGAKFALFRNNLKIGEYVSNEDGKIEIQDLCIYGNKKNVAANYELKEIVAPNGYSAGRNIKFKVQEEDGKLKFVEELTDGQKATKYKVENKKIVVTVENDASFKLIKKDGETEKVLANCKFALYNTDNGQTPAVDSKGKIIGEKIKIGNKEYYAITTDENGEIILDLPRGSYKLVEIQASEDYYDTTNCVYEFEIKKDKVEAKVEEVEILDVTGESNYDEITSIVNTADGGYIIAGSFRSSQIKIGSKTLSNAGTTSNADAMIVKYNGLGQVVWANSIGGTGTEKINSVIETSDGGCIVVGSFSSSTVNVNEKTLTNSGSTSYADGMIVKYDYNGDVEWAKAIGGYYTEEFTSVAETRDNGCLVVGTFSSSSIQIEDCKIVNNGSSDIMIIKQDRKGEIEWAKSFGGNNSDKINSITATMDGGYLIGGEFSSSTIQIGDKTITNTTSSSYSDAMLVKFNENDVVEWVKSFGGNYSDRINKIIETRDGGYLLGGEFNSSNIQMGSITLNNLGYSNYADAMLIKCSNTGEAQWGKTMGGNYSDRINSIIETADGGYLAAGEFFSSTLKVEEETLKNKGSTSYADGILIKYSNNGNVEWAKSIGGTNSQQIKAIAEISNGHYVLGGNFYNTSFNIDDKIITNEGYSNAIKIKINQIYNTQEQTKLEVTNNVKQFIITTDVKEKNGVKGGTITGEDENPYETVRYDGTSEKEIKIIPNINYKIEKILVNGVNYQYQVANNGSYTMPQFENMRENKHIEVCFKPIYERATVKIQYVDIDTKEIITYVDNSGQTKNYNYEISGNVGEKYNTEEKDIPNYEPVSELNIINRNREFTSGNVTLTYYYRKLPFNMSIDKIIDVVKVNGEIKNINNKKLFKIEVKNSEKNNTEIIATYKLTVSNKGKVAGKAKITETIPNRLIISENNADYWNKTEDNKLETNVELQPGESKELEITLKWKDLQDNYGLIKNTAEIVETSNVLNYPETTKEDNISEAEMLISIKTGSEKINIKIVFILFAILFFSLAIKLGKKETKNK